MDIQVVAHTKVKAVRYGLLKFNEELVAARLELIKSLLPLIGDALKPYFGLPSMGLCTIMVGKRKYLLSPVSYTSHTIYPDQPLDYKLLTPNDRDMLGRYLLFRYLCQFDTKPHHLRMRWIDSQWHLVSIRERKMVEKPLTDSLLKYLSPLPSLSLPEGEVLKQTISAIDPTYTYMANNIITRWRDLRDQPPPIIVNPTPLPLELIP